MTETHPPNSRPPPGRAGPSLAEQGQCRTFEELRALYVRYGAEPERAERRAKHVLAGRERPKTYRKKRRKRGCQGGPKGL